MFSWKVLKSELYKNISRKSTLILLIPAALSLLIAIGVRSGALELTLTTGETGALSCMDYLFLSWTVLSSLGITGITLLLFSSFAFSGEIERGQIRLYLLRTGTRSGVLLGKYLASVIASLCSILAVLACTVISYYWLIAGSSLGNGGFHGSAVGGLGTGEILAYIGLGLVMYLLWISVTFLIGLFCGPFVTFILSAVFLYGGNYLAARETAFSKLLPAYWGNQLLTGEWDSWLPAAAATVFLLLLVCLILGAAIWRFSRMDVR